MAGAQEHRCLERWDDCVRLISHHQDRGRDATYPKGAGGNACRVPAIGQKMLPRDGYILARERMHLDWQIGGESALMERLYGGINQPLKVLLVLNNKIARFPRKIW